MTDRRPICPIPPDAKVGDVVVLRDGQRIKISGGKNKAGEYRLASRPCFIHESGKYLNVFLHSIPKWDCVAFEYADGRKPKRTQAQRDAAWLRKQANKWAEERESTRHDVQRMLAIADRLEKQQ